MKKALAALLLIMVLFTRLVVVNRPSAYASGKILTLYGQSEGSSYYTYKMTSGSKLGPNGCGIFMTAHAIQWLTGNNPPIKTVCDKCGNTVASYGTAESYLKKQYDIIVFYKISKTESKVKSVLDNNGVISHHKWGHYILLVGYKSVGGTTYIHVVDSSAGTTLKNYKGGIYSYSGMQKVNSEKDFYGNDKAKYHDAAEYWVKCSEIIVANNFTYTSGDKAGQACSELLLDSLVAPAEKRISGIATFIRDDEVRVGPKETSDLVLCNI